MSTMMIDQFITALFVCWSDSPQTTDAACLNEIEYPFLFA